MSVQTISVAVIEPVGGHGGMDYYDFGLCKGLAHSGCNVALYTCDETVRFAGTEFMVFHTYVGIYGKAAAWIRGLRYLRGSIIAIWFATREKRAICHFHFFHAGLLELFNVALAKLLRRHVVVTSHDVTSFVDGLEIKVLSRWVYHLADSVIAHNMVTRHELIDRISVPAERIAVIPHGNYLHVLRNLPAQEEARHDLNIPVHSKTILFFGQIKDVKGLDLLLNAMPEVLMKNPDTTLLIAGRPWKSDFSAYETQIENLGIRGQCITHIRYIPDDEVPLYYSAADIVVLPYRRIYQSGVVLMAMSYGRPVIVSDLPGMTEIVIDGVNGYVFSQGQTNDLARKINIALAEMDKSQRLAEQGLQLMRDKYDWEMIGHKTALLYNKLLT